MTAALQWSRVADQLALAAAAGFADPSCAHQMAPPTGLDLELALMNGQLRPREQVVLIAVRDDKVPVHPAQLAGGVSSSSSSSSRQQDALLCLAGGSHLRQVC